ncbi:hypothetical protein [Mesorhizobium sophorae]|nr:hypothetical protein [Mesorhizobium sophorae]
MRRKIASMSITQEQVARSGIVETARHGSGRVDDSVWLGRTGAAR